MHGSIMTLQEHLCDAGCYSEVTINLEWWMGIKEIRIGSSLRIFLYLRIRWQQAKHIADDSESMIAIEHACPEVRLPTQTPARSLVATMLQSSGCGMEQFRMRERRNLIGWIQSIEMRDMAMLILRIIRIHKPLLQLSVLSYLHRRNLRNQLLHRLALSLINPQYFRSLHGTGQGIEGYLVIHRATCRYGSSLTHRSLFRTHRRHGYLPFCARQLLHIVEIELSGTFYYRIPLLEESLIARIEIMLPEMGGEPGSTIREHAPLRTVHRTCYAPDIGVMMCHPATATIHFPSRLCSRYAQILNQRIQRFRGVTEIRYLGRPVVHLRIDVDGIFAVPRRIFAVVPNTLQVCSLSTRLGRGDEQIATIVIHQCHHRHILAARKFLQALVGRQRSIGISCQSQGRSTKLFLIGLHMAFLQLCIAHQFHLIYIVGIALGCIARHIVIVHKIGGSTHNDGCLGAICLYICHAFSSESRLDALLVLSLHLQHNP